MKQMRFIYWKSPDFYVGYLEEFPDYMTQGKTLAELKLNLKDIFSDCVKNFGVAA